jgi:amino acid adenylation domain-containing protein
LFTTLLAAQYVLLHRLTGQSDVAVGIPVADRSSKETEALVAHCINFLPVRLQMASQSSFEDILAEVKKTFLAAYDHRACTLGTLIQKLNLPRDQSRMPLAPVAFNLDRLRASAVFPDLETEVSPNRKGLCSFDLNLNVSDANRHARLDCRYNANLFRPETIRRWLGHFQTLLQGIVLNPRQRISELPLLPEAERNQLLVEWNNTAVEYPRDKCPHHLFEEQVCRTPEAPAVVFGDKTLTYSELDRQADQVASGLRALGIGPETPVGLCLERSDTMVIALLGILKAGGAYVPLDPAYPAERIGLMLRGTRALLMLAQRKFGPSLESEFSDMKRAFVEDLLAPSGNGSDRKPVDPDITSRDLAYVIHTSGSTGVAKPVAIEHRNAVNFISWAGRVFTREELAGVLFSTSICFDLSVFEVFGTLCNGGKLIVAANAMELPELPARNQVTLINTVPSAAASLLRANAIPSSVRVMNLAGEPLKQELVDKLYGLENIEKVYDLYGPSETTTYSTYSLRQKGGGETIGRPIANTQVYLLDAQLQPVPIGIPGEIYIGGDGVARGYLYRPELTAERFVVNPVAQKNAVLSEARVYKTGDLARWLPDGSLQFLGRTDSQVKIRGFRVEPGEVQTVLLQHAAVQEAFVMGREDESGTGKQLVAYVVPGADALPARADDKAGSVRAPGSFESELKSFLELKLPHYMVPAHFVLLPELPLSPNGKIDFRALPEPDFTRPHGGESFVAPQPGTEETLAAIWREVLNVDRIGANDNFFTLGGHSLLVMQVISRAREIFQVELPLRRFFEAPTIAAMAHEIGHNGDTVRAGGPVLARRTSRSRAADLLSRVEDLSDEEVERLLNDPELKAISP